MSTPVPSLHHASCGCPGTLGLLTADASAAVAAAAAQVADTLTSNYRNLYRLGSIKAERRLRVAYMIPHHHVTGGLKALCLHIRLLREKGHHVLAVYRPVAPRPNGISPAATTAATGSRSGASRAMPAWCGVDADEEVLLGPDQHLSSAYPDLASLDAVVCGMFQQARCCQSGNVPFNCHLYRV